MKEENIGICFSTNEFDEIMAYAEKGEFDTVQEAVLFAIRACAKE